MNAEYIDVPFPLALVEDLQCSCQSSIEAERMAIASLRKRGEKAAVSAPCLAAFLDQCNDRINRLQTIKETFTQAVEARRKQGV